MVSLGFVVAILGIASASIKMPLQRIETFREKMIKKGQWKEFNDILTKKHLNRFGNPKHIKTVISEPWTDYNDLLYVANITIGTPAQQFRVIMDTGSANLWIPNDQCGQSSGGQNCQDLFGDPCCSDGNYCTVLCTDPTCCNSCSKGMPFVPKNSRAAGNCDGKALYQNKTSTSYTSNGQTFSIEYGTGSCSGVLGNDVVTFEDASTKVGPIAFGMANELASFFANQPFDGICGMAFTSLAVDHIPPPFQAMINANLFNGNNFFDVWLTATGTPSGALGGGMITLGGYDPNNCAPPSSITWIPLSSKTYYQFMFTKWTLKSKTETNGNKGWQTIADTGTSLLAGPQADLDKMMKALRISSNYDSDVGLNHISCYDAAHPTALPNMVFTIAGKQFAIQPKNYVLKAGLSPSHPNRCYFGMQAFGSGGFGPSWIHGDVFLRQFCTTFDMGTGSSNTNARIGFRNALN